MRWFNKRDIYIDKIKIWDDYGLELWERTDQVAAPRLDNWFAKYFRNSDAVLGYYIMDDRDMRTGRDHVYSTRRIDSLMVHRFGAKAAFNVPAASDLTYSNITGYSNLSYQAYPITIFTSTSSTPQDSTSLQFAWNRHCGWLADMANIAESKSIPHFATIQGFSLDCYPERPYWNWRTPTGAENLCMANLAIAYGAQGLLYWKYDAVDHCHNTYFAAFVDSLGNRAAMYYQVRDIVGPWIDKIGPIVSDFDWQGACAWNQGLSSKPYSFLLGIDSTNYPINSAYIQSAFFRGADDAGYVMFVNRRCLQNESQSFVAIVNPTVYPFTKAVDYKYVVTDLVTNDIDTSRLSFRVQLGPGEAKIFRVAPFGTRYGTMQFSQTWTSNNGPYEIIGDYEVCPSCTLNIEDGAQVTFLNNNDFMRAGYDTLRSELIVKGTVNINGEDASRVVFRPSVDRDYYSTEYQEWYGVRVEPGGSLSATNAIFQQAYAALDFQNLAENTVEECEFDTCFMYGIRSTNPKLDIRRNHFANIAQGYAIHITDSSTIFGNVFHAHDWVMPVGIRAQGSSAFIDSNVFQGSNSISYLGWAIQVDGRKSNYQPVRINRAYIDNPIVGIEIGRGAFAIIENSELYGGLGCCLAHTNGILESQPSFSTTVKNTLIEGFWTGAYGWSGTMNLGTLTSGVGGRNAIYAPCEPDLQSCDFGSHYTNVYSGSISGYLKAEDNHWTFPCSTNVLPEDTLFGGRAKLDFRPNGTFADSLDCEAGWGGGQQSKVALISKPLPEQFSLSQNWPNPFNPATKITYSLPISSYVQLSILNILGQRVKTLVSSVQPPGRYEVAWDGTDDTGSHASSGVYFYRLKTGEFQDTKKMILIK